MTPRYSGYADECPYDLVSRSIAGCPRFDPRVIFDGLDDAIVTCAHVRCSITRPSPEGSPAASFYPRCVLRTAEVEAERHFAVPLD